MKAEMEASSDGTGSDEISPLELLRRKVRIVRLLCRVGLAFSLVAREAGVVGQRQQREDQPTVARFYSELDGAELEFDVGDYRFSSDEEHRWPVSARGAVLKLPLYRESGEADRILALMQQLKFCRRLPAPVQRRMAEQAYYMRLEQGRDVLRAGHPGYSFYVIFSGLVRVSAGQDASEAEPILLRKGDAFGERTLLFEALRDVTVTTEKLTEFLIVYDDCFFDSGLSDCLGKQYRRIERFLRSLPLFSSLSTSALSDLSHRSTLLEYLDGSTIVRSSLHTQLIWFVMSGSADIYGRVSRLDSAAAAEKNSSLQNWLAEVDARLPQSGVATEAAAASARISRSRRAPFLLPGEAAYLVKVGHLTPGKSFGLSAVFDPQSRDLSLMSRGCEVLALPRQALLSAASRRQLESAHLLYEAVPTDRRMQRRCELQCDWMLYRRREVRATVHRLRVMSDRFDKMHPPLPPASQQQTATDGLRRGQVGARRPQLQQRSRRSQSAKPRLS